MLQALQITVPPSFKDTEAQIIRTVILSHYYALAAAVSAAFPEPPDHAADKLLERTIEFALEHFPGTMISVRPQVDVYDSTLVEELRTPDDA